MKGLFAVTSIRSFLRRETLTDTPRGGRTFGRGVLALGIGSVVAGILGLISSLLADIGALIFSTPPMVFVWWGLRLSGLSVLLAFVAYGIMRKKLYWAKNVWVTGLVLGFAGILVVLVSINGSAFFVEEFAVSALLAVFWVVLSIIFRQRFNNQIFAAIGAVVCLSVLAAGLFLRAFFHWEIFVDGGAFGDSLGFLAYFVSFFAIGNGVFGLLSCGALWFIGTKLSGKHDVQAQRL